MKKTFLLLALSVALLTACGEKPQPSTPSTAATILQTASTQPPLQGWQEQAGHTYYYTDGTPHTGWLSLEGKQYYFREDGRQYTGWLELQEGRYFFLSDGMITGWKTINGNRYYFLSDGTLASGAVEIEGILHHFSKEGTPLTGWQEKDGSRCYLNSDGAVHTGWLEEDEKRWYLGKNGTPALGWLEIDGQRYHMDEDGTAHVGWLYTQDGTYYFRADGTMAQGRTETDRGIRYFASTGKEVILVNPWNTVPDEYSPTIVDYEGWQMDASCRDALKQMLRDCAKAGHTAIVVSAYRSHEYQKNLFQNRIQRFMDEGYDRDEAERLAAMRVARPGTSEHELGLALDIVDINYQNLNEVQETMPAQIWLMENSWRYGFILRYPNGTTDSTGIIYEPWHYRYVGVELSSILQDCGLCLEEYLNNLP